MPQYELNRKPIVDGSSIRDLLTRLFAAKTPSAPVANRNVAPQQPSPLSRWLAENNNGFAASQESMPQRLPRSGNQPLGPMPSPQEMTNLSGTDNPMDIQMPAPATTQQQAFAQQAAARPAPARPAPARPAAPPPSYDAAAMDQMAAASDYGDVEGTVDPRNLDARARALAYVLRNGGA